MTAVAGMDGIHKRGHTLITVNLGLGFRVWNPGGRLVHPMMTPAALWLKSSYYDKGAL